MKRTLFLLCPIALLLVLSPTANAGDIGFSMNGKLCRFHWGFHIGVGVHHGHRAPALQPRCCDPPPVIFREKKIELGEPEPAPVEAPPPLRAPSAIRKLVPSALARRA